MAAEDLNRAEAEQRDLFMDYTEGGTLLVDPPMLVVPAFAEPARAVAATPTSQVSDLETEEKVQRALAAIDSVMEAGHPISPAYSGGKDSSVLLALVIEAARRRIEAGKPVPPIAVTHANTGIENPAMAVVTASEITRIRAYAKAHKLPVTVDVATPALNDTWAVRIIGGRALPTFANSSTRDCTINWKLQPQERQRKRILKDLQVTGQPVVMTGTRFEESTGRAQRMTDRGELDTEIWEEPVRRPDGSLLRNELRMSPIAHWTQEDVWVFLSELGAGERLSYTDAKDIWDVYRDGGNSSCVVVADDSMKANAKACGARFGCSLCVAVGRDKSLEAMLDSDPKYDYLVPLNQLQRFLVDTQYDLDRRLWLGRSIDKDGFIAIAPDAYSPGMQEELLRYALTVDVIEKENARYAGVQPRFELVSLEQLIAIDVVWALQGYHSEGFKALSIYDEVYNQGQRFHPPAVDASRFEKKMPSPRYLYVGNDWDSDPGFDTMYSGARNLMADMSGATEMHACASNVQTKSGHMILESPVSDFFEIDSEAASDFMTFEVMDGGLVERMKGHGPRAAFDHYQLLGLFSTSRRHQAIQDEMLRRAAWKERHGVFSMSRDELLNLSVSRAEREAGLRSPPGTLTLPDALARKEAREAESRRRRTLRHYKDQGITPPASLLQPVPLPTPYIPPKTLADEADDAADAYRPSMRN